MDDAKEKRTDITKKEFDARMSTVEAFYARKKALLDKDYGADSEAADKLAEAFKTGMNKALSDNDASQSASIEKTLSDKVALLEEYKEMEVVSTEEYEARKTDLEKEAALKREEIQEQSRLRQLRSQAFYDAISEQKQRDKEARSIKLDMEENAAKLKVVEKSTQDQLAANGSSFEEIQNLIRKNEELEKKQAELGYDEKRSLEIEANKALLATKTKGLDESTKRALKS